jgi:hypothetical protein
MIRTSVRPSNNSITLDIPSDYIGRQIEVIAFANDEGIDQRKNLSKKPHFTVLKVSRKGFKFNRDEANER